MLEYSRRSLRNNTLIEKKKSEPTAYLLFRNSVLLVCVVFNDFFACTCSLFPFLQKKYVNVLISKMCWHLYGYICLLPFNDRLGNMLLGASLGTNPDDKLAEILFFSTSTMKPEYYN